MKIVYSAYPTATPTVPINGGYRCQFANNKCVMPDDVADTLVGMSGGFYSIIAQDLSQVLDGAKILIIRDAGVGDVLLVTPLIRRLHEDKNAVVDVLTFEANRCLFDGNPHVRQTFALEHDTTVRTDYDVVLDLRLIVENAEATGRTTHRADAFAQFADVRLFGEEDRHLDYFPTDAEITAIQDRFARGEKASRPDGTLCPTVAYVYQSTTANRNWSKDTHHAVLLALIATGFVVILLDAKPVDMSNYIQDVNLLNWTGALSLRGVGAAIAYSDAVITPDTGLFHLAGALNKPTLTYFGAFPVEERHTHTQLTVVNNPRSCALGPCRQYGCLNFDANHQSNCLAVDPVAVVSRLGELLNVQPVLERPSPQNNADATEPDAHHHEGRDGDRRLGASPAATNPVPDPAPVRKPRTTRRGNRAAGDARPVLPTDQ